MTKAPIRHRSAARSRALRVVRLDGVCTARTWFRTSDFWSELCPSRTAVPTPAPAQDRPILPDCVDSDELMSGTDAAWARSLGSRAVAVEPLSVPDAIRRTGLTITTMGQPLAADAHACAWLGAAASWLADGA